LGPAGGGVDAGLPPVFVVLAVVVAAEQGAVVEGVVAAVFSGVEVVDVAVAGRDRAAGGDTASVADHDGGPQAG
jgi:hypothetical protein